MIPAISFRGIYCKYVFAKVPARTAIADDKTKAPAEARKIIVGDNFEFVANNNVAICVLSPNSAKKTDKKIANHAPIKSPNGIFSY